MSNNPNDNAARRESGAETPITTPNVHKQASSDGRSENTATALESFRTARADRLSALAAFLAVDKELAAALKACPQKDPIWNVATPEAAARIRADFRDRHDAARVREESTFRAVGRRGRELAAALNKDAGTTERFVWCNPDVPWDGPGCGNSIIWERLGWGILDNGTGNHATISKL